MIRSIYDTKFHIVFWPDEAKFVDGGTHTPDIVICATADAWTDMVTGKKKWSERLREGTLFIIGAANEIQPFIQIAVLKELCLPANFSLYLFFHFIFMKLYRCYYRYYPNV
jgi:hypothetical protein